MMPRVLPATATFALAFASAAAAQEPIVDRGPTEHLLHQGRSIEWRDAPASLERGAQVAILEGNPSQPGVFTMRIRMPDGFRIAPHSHLRPERVTVLSGTFRLGAGTTFDAAATTPLGAGSYTAMPPGMVHYAIAEGETVIQLTSTGPWDITYARPGDDPRLRAPADDADRGADHGGGGRDRAVLAGDRAAQ
jgi:quercetin dioxygenase-like cupin family protein